MKTRWVHYFFELPVVVAGILIAFVLNNWHESHIQSKMEQQYLNSFLVDLAQDSLQIDSLLTQTKPRIHNLTRLIAFLSENNPQNDSLLIAFQALLSLNFFQPHITTYESMKSSGDFNLIASYALKREITNYYQTLEGKKYFDQILRSYLNDFTIPFTLKHLDLWKNRFLNPSSLRKPYFTNMVLGYRSLLKQNIRFHQTLLAKCRKLMQQIRQQLKK